MLNNKDRYSANKLKNLFKENKSLYMVLLHKAQELKAKFKL